ncbi:MAG: hypothetical protein V1735_02475 [Nanoarchaeota archaeon]
MATTIQVSDDLQSTLNKLKLFSRETYEEVIWNLIEDRRELSDETMKEIAEARKEVAGGEFVTLADLKKKFGVK